LPPLKSTATLLAVLVPAGTVLAEEGRPCAAVEADLLEALRARHFLDAHTLALTAAALCPAARVRHATYDAVALLELDDAGRARATLARVIAGADAPLRLRAQVLIAWSYLRERDDQAFRRALTAPARRAPAAARDPRGHRSAGAAPRPRRRARARPARPADHLRPPPCGRRNTPGALELARRRLPFTAGAAGLAASFFHVGNVINAADLARRRNETAAAPLRLQLERALVPEAHP
jgi:hypothetical protein